MRGCDDRSLLSYIDLEKRIRQDHPLRTIRRLVDDALAAMDRAFADLYSALGRPRSPQSASCGLCSCRPSIPFAPSASSWSDWIMISCSGGSSGLGSTTRSGMRPASPRTATGCSKATSQLGFCLGGGA